jgi:uncharacterized protein (TIGR03000 family)
VGVGHVSGGWGHAGTVHNHGSFYGRGFGGYRGYYPGAFGYYPFGYGYGVGPYYDDGYASPYYSDYSYASPSYYADSDYYGGGSTGYPATSYASGYPSAQAQSSDKAAEIDVLLPQPDAKIWVDGIEMSAGAGTKRSFLSPPLQSGYSYSYRIAASWMENGQQVRVERTVPVASGQRSVVDFSRPQGTLTMPLAQP